LGFAPGCVWPQAGCTMATGGLEQPPLPGGLVLMGGPPPVVGAPDGFLQPAEFGTTLASAVASSSSSPAGGEAALPPPPTLGGPLGGSLGGPVAAPLGGQLGGVTVPGGVPLLPGGVQLVNLLPMPGGPLTSSLLAALSSTALRTPKGAPPAPPAGPRGPPGGLGSRPPAPKPESKTNRMWPVFVGNISFDTQEEEVGDLFRAMPNLHSFRLAHQNVLGGSRGFGFAEFTDPLSALESIKKLDGSDIRGRKLRMRWGESSPTTPEVDDFHRTPERYKTRPCFEAFRGMVCPRSDCPYAHSDAEIRPPPEGGVRSSKDTPPRPAGPDVNDPKKVVVPFADFEGSTDEEKQRAAYTAVLGTGASHIRFMMRRTGCRLQLRGAGDRDSGSVSSSLREPLHVIVKPGVDGKEVTQEQIDLVKRTIDEIAKFGKPLEIDGPGGKDGGVAASVGGGGASAGAPSTGAEGASVSAGGDATAKLPEAEPSRQQGQEEAASPDQPQPEPCVLGTACAERSCRLQHPRLPGLTPEPAANARLRFFVMRSVTLANIQTSVRQGVWATSRSNTDALRDAWAQCDHVVLIFSANESGHFQGYGRMASLPDRELATGLWGRMSNRLGENFKVAWIKQCMLPFAQTDNLRNGFNDDLPLRKSRDGQEVPVELAEVLVRLMFQQDDEDLLNLPAGVANGTGGAAAECPDGEREASPRCRSRSPRQGRQSQRLRSSSHGGRRSRSRGRGPPKNSSPGAWVPPKAQESTASADDASKEGHGGPKEATKVGGDKAAADAAPAWTKKPTGAWTLPGCPGPAEPPGAPRQWYPPGPGPPPGHPHGMPPPPPGWGCPYGPPPGWGYPPPGYPPPPHGHPMMGMPLGAPPPGWPMRPM